MTKLSPLANAQLEAKKPYSKSLKLMLYGAPGTGKTLLACKFPNTVYIDAEKTINSEYKTLLDENNSLLVRDNCFDSVYALVVDLLKTKHNYKTLVIDSISVIWDDLLELNKSLLEERAVRRVKAQSRYKPVTEDSLDKAIEGATAFAKHKTEAKVPMKKLLRIIDQLDMNVIFIAQEKKAFDKTQDITFEGLESLDYNFDLVIRTVIQNSNKRIGVVTKSRYSTFRIASEVELIPDLFTAKFSGIDHVDSIKKEFATEKQIIEYKKLKEHESFPLDSVSKALQRASVNDFGELDIDRSTKLLEYIYKIVGSSPSGIINEIIDEKVYEMKEELFDPSIIDKLHELLVEDKTLEV